MLTAEQPNREPYGKVYEKEREPCSGGHYLSTDIWKIVPNGHCAVCEKKIVPYAEVYYQKHNDNGIAFCWKYDARYYCKECAERETRNEYMIFLPREERRFSSVKDNQTLQTIEYEDGSLLEEMTSREKSR